MYNNTSMPAIKQTVIFTQCDSVFLNTQISPIRYVIFTQKLYFYFDINCIF